MAPSGALLHARPARTLVFNIDMDWTHLHLLLNHFPTIGMVTGLGLLLVSLAGSNDLKRASLLIFFGISLLTIPIYISGNIAHRSICNFPPMTPEAATCMAPGIPDAAIKAHESAAVWGFLFMEVLGAFSWLGLWQFRRISRLPGWNLGVILLLSLVTFAVMVRVSNIGGQIRHPEIADPRHPEAMVTMARDLGRWVVGTKWVWPTCETLHFVGLSLMFGVAALADLRMLGMLKRVSYSALHRLLPWSILGFGINVITGMLFFIGAPEQYTDNVVFKWKIVLMMITGMNVLYFTLFDEVWTIGPGDDAPFTAKAVAATALALVVGVLYCGRMLPFIG